MIASTKRAVAYYRMSSDKQETSIDDQRRAVEQFANDNGFHITREYLDEGISGSDSTRPGFQKLISDADSERDFDLVICWDQDRFSRFDPLEANHYWFLLRNAGVRIVTVAQGELDFDDLGGWLKSSVVQHGKAQYLRDLSRNVVRGRINKAKSGKWSNGKAPYGYRLNGDGQFDLGPAEEVDTVKVIFDRYLGGECSLFDLAGELNDLGIPSPSGRKWGKHSVMTILKRETYTGTAAQMKVNKGKFHTAKGDRVAVAGPLHTIKAKEDWITMPCPVIISRETFDAVQSRMAERRKKTTPKSSKVKASLPGLLVCSQCGGKMFASVDGKGNTIYLCQTYHNFGKRECNRNGIKEAGLLDFLVEAVREQALSEKNVNRLKTAIERRAAKPNDSKADVRRIRHEIKAVAGEITEAVAELKRTPDDLYDLAVDHVRELKAKHARLEEQLRASGRDSKRPTAKADVRAKQALQQLQRLREGLESVDQAIVRRAFAKVIDRVELRFDQHVSESGYTRSKLAGGTVHLNSQISNLFDPIIQRN